MSPSLVIAKYRCHVAGEPTDSVDYQVRYFECNADSAVQRIKSEKPSTYENEDGEMVTWDFVEIMTTEEEPKIEDGEEIIGFLMAEDPGTEKAEQMAGGDSASRNATA